MMVVVPTPRRRRRRRTLHPSLSAVVILFFLLSAVSIAKAADGPPEVKTGTTIIAVRFRDGVVVGTDTRTSVSGYVSNRYASKVAFVLDRGPVEEDEGDDGETEGICSDRSTCAVCRSGSAADTQRLADLCRGHLLRRSLVHRRHSTPSDAARLLRNLVRNDPDLSAGLICAGYDHVRGEGAVYSISPGGSMVEETDGWAAGGSGSGYVLGYIDANYPRRVGRGVQGEEWTEEEAVEFVTECVRLAMERDGSSGGLVILYVLNGRGRRAEVRTPSSSLGGGGDGEDRRPSASFASAELKGFAPPSPI